MGKKKKRQKVIDPATFKTGSEQVDRFLPMVWQMLNTVLEKSGRLPPAIDRNDLFVAGLAGLLDAIMKFDPHRGISFEAYAQFRVRWAIQDEIRGIDFGQRRTEMIRNTLLPAVQESVLDNLLEEERNTFLARWIQEMSQRNQLIIGLYFEADLTQKEISQIVGISTSHVNRIIVKTAKLLKARLKDLDR